MSKILVTLPDEMHQALKDESKRQEMAQSLIVRKALAKWLEWETGEQYDWRMEWGGSRQAMNGK